MALRANQRVSIFCDADGVGKQVPVNAERQGIVEGIAKSRRGVTQGGVADAERGVVDVAVDLTVGGGRGETVVVDIGSHDVTTGQRQRDSGVRRSCRSPAKQTRHPGYAGGRQPSQSIETLTGFFHLSPTFVTLEMGRLW